MLAPELHFAPLQVLADVSETTFAAVARLCGTRMNVSREVLGRSASLVARRENYAVGADTGLHRHMDFWALYIARGGRGVHEIDGHPFGVARGDIYVMPPLSTHRYFDYHALQIDAFYFGSEIFTGEEWDILRAQSGFWRLFVNDNPNDSPQARRFRLDAQTTRSTQDAADLLRDECAWRDDLSPLLWRQQFFALVAGLTRAQNKSFPSSASTCNATNRTFDAGLHENGLANVLRFCQMNFAREVTVPMLAAQMFLSPGRFSQVFAREMGTSPAAYLRDLRLERAQQLLRESDFSVGRIAVECGFADGAQLCRAFVRQLGLSPRAYRNNFGSEKSRPRS